MPTLVLNGIQRLHTFLWELPPSYRALFLSDMEAALKRVRIKSYLKRNQIVTPRDTGDKEVGRRNRETTGKRQIFSYHPRDLTITLKDGGEPPYFHLCSCWVSKCSLVYRSTCSVPACMLLRHTLRIEISCIKHLHAGLFHSLTGARCGTLQEETVKWAEVNLKALRLGSGAFQLSIATDLCSDTRLNLHW
jgi:hypothetical protein